jgi:hypothetical protein
MANHRFNIGAIEKAQPLRNPGGGHVHTQKDDSQISLCDSCVHQLDGSHYSVCDASIEVAEEVRLCYVVRRCAAYQNIWQ